MTELDEVMRHARAALEAGQAAALASIVYVYGSSYRKPGARMLVTSAGTAAGAVSGGCVERAVAAAAQRVLASGAPEMMVYDGRYRLGCEGTLYILIEPFAPADAAGLFEAYTQAKGNGRAARSAFEMSSAFAKTAPDAAPPDPQMLGTVLRFDHQTFALRKGFVLPEDGETPVLTKVIPPAPQLYVIGTEYDATVLARLAASQAWDAHLITHPRNPLSEIAGVTVRAVDPPELLRHLSLDAQTAVVLMSHNYARDLAYLRALAEAPTLRYLGILGPAKRRRALFDELAEYTTDWPAWMHDDVYGPAGIDLGGELPEQIALSIMAEIVAVFNDRPVPSLRDKRGTIHAPPAVS